MGKYVIDNLKLIIPKESMEKLYLEEKLTIIKQIADKNNAKPTSINSLIDEYGIVKRTKGSGGIRNYLEKRLTEMDLIHFYHDLDMTLIDIADIYKVSAQTVTNLMTKYKIERRRNCRRKKYRELFPEGHLEDLIYNQGKSLAEIARGNHIPERTQRIQP